MPLLITSVNDPNMRLVGMLFFFAMLWGGFFRGVIVKTNEKVLLPVAAFFFTGIIGIPALLFIYTFLPNIYTGLSDSDNHIARLLGCVFHTGVCEELCKIVPVVIYICYKRKAASPYMILLVGIFSGLGFAAFENIIYSAANVDTALLYLLLEVDRDGADGLVSGVTLGVHGAMINVMLRSVSLVFADAIWTAIFSYFIATAFVSGERRFVLCFLGFAVPAVLHGSYNWLCSVQPVFAAGIIAFSFILFYGYLLKIRQRLEPPVDVNATVST